jgi:hypothetical protein
MCRAAELSESPDGDTDVQATKMDKYQAASRQHIKNVVNEHGQLTISPIGRICIYT